MWGLDSVTVENVLFTTAYVLALVFAGQIFWLLGRRQHGHWKAARLAKLDRLHAGLLLDVLDSGLDAKSLAPLRTVPRGDLRDWLTAIAARTTGDYLDRIRQVYAELGLAARDLSRFLRSRRLGQLVTARRLALMGPSTLLEGARGVHARSHEARLLMLMAAGPNEPVHLLLTQLRDWPEVDELQAHPLRIVLRRLRPQQHESLMAHWSEIEAPTVRALVLREACLQLPERQSPWLKTAFASSSSVLRSTACDICREMGRVDQSVRLIMAVEDSTPDVRRAAVEALGRLAVESGRDPLIRALQDPDFEVQVAAAYALFRFGADGRSQLQWARQMHPDRRCRSVVAMVLDELDTEAA